MGAAFVLLVFADTFLTGYMVAKYRGIQREYRRVFRTLAQLSVDSDTGAASDE